MMNVGVDVHTCRTRLLAEECAVGSTRLCVLYVA